jgi:predicted DNA-binding antitoxin AbrB/MazE fold protein
VIKLGKTIKARYKDGTIKPLETLNIPDNAEITITINNLSKKSKKTNLVPPSNGRTENQDWQKLRGILKGTTALQDHEQERELPTTKVRGLLASTKG